MTSIYDVQFGGNILAVGRTGCGKTTFLEKLGINRFFGDLVKTEWISGIDIYKKREAKIQSCFSNETEVHVAKEPDELDLHVCFSRYCCTNFAKIISQTNNFNIFLASIPQNTVVKILQSNCVSQSKKYVPVRSLWVNRVFTHLANSLEKHCLTIDCSYKNKNAFG